MKLGPWPGQEWAGWAADDSCLDWRLALLAGKGVIGTFIVFIKAATNLMGGPLKWKIAKLQLRYLFDPQFNEIAEVDLG